jgi:methylated-DNA-protein-cysteine methyltransferase-like protein
MHGKHNSGKGLRVHSHNITFTKCFRRLVAVFFLPQKRMNGMKEYTFFESVYDVVRLIPPGRVTNYGAIAKYLGTGLSSRMVGWAMNAAHGKNVPAHRVVNRNGMLTGKHHFATPFEMEELLAAEGVKVKNDKVVDFTQLYWDPSKELNL